jgi:flagellar hook-length control protein FliK
VLVPAAKDSARPAPAEVDAVRLLSRVARAFAAAGERDGEIHLRLSPPELGALRLEVRVEEGTLVARLHTETEAARAAIVDNLSVLRDRLAEQGVRVERFDVDLMQRQPGGMPDQPGGRGHEPPAAAVATRQQRPHEEMVAAPGSTVVPNGKDGLNVVI